MNFDAPDMLSLLILLIWTYMHVPKWINPIFHQILPNREVVRALVKLASIRVVADLFEVLQAASPPSLAWLKSLLNPYIVMWGVYIIVLEKPGYLPKIYIGSSTAAKGGLKNRMKEYDRLSVLPEYVLLAVNDGYIIVSKGVLLYCPIPAAKDVPRIRVVILALEAAFTFILWAIYSQTKDFGYGEIVPWSRKVVEWLGLCSHNPLSDPVVGEFDLTDDQREAMAASVKEKNKEYQHEYGKQMRANAEDEYKAKQKAANEKRAPVQKEIYAEAKASKKF